MTLGLRHVRHLPRVLRAHGEDPAALAAVWDAVTEDDLPVRTQIGFAAVVAIGLGWVFVAGRALLKRGRYRATVTVTSRDDAGMLRTRSARLTLKPKR